MESLTIPGFNTAAAYSPAIRVGNMVFISGQVPMDVSTGEVVGETIEEQTRKTFANLEHLLESNGMGLESIAKMTIYITDINELGVMNEVYTEIMGAHKPARACVEVSRLALDMKIEIEAVAVQD